MSRHLRIQCSAEREAGGQDSPQCSESFREWIRSPHRRPVESPRLRLLSPAEGLEPLRGHCQKSGRQPTQHPRECSHRLVVTVHIADAAAPELCSERAWSLQSP